MGPLWVRKKGEEVGKTKWGQGTQLMVLVDGQNTLLGLHVDSASSAEFTLLEQTLDMVAVRQTGRPGRLRT